MSESTIETKATAAKAYLEKDVVPILTKALAKMCVEEPDDPYMWLAKVHPLHFECRHHPQRFRKI
jgi:hypothetical protein